jgi:hypothetical protein
MRRGLARLASIGLVLGIVAASACSDNGLVTYADAGPTTTPGAGVGQACSVTTTCREGLNCTAGVCQPCQCGGAGVPCTISEACSSGSYCGPARTCAPAGTGVADASCKSDGDCAGGLRCDLVGLSAQCEPEGTKDVGGACMTSADCLGGLACSGSMCAPLPPVPDGGVPLLAFPPTWTGETCTDVSGPTQAYFRVPRGTADGDFYRLPFPNDVRNTNGTISLSNPDHPTPGSALLGYDVVQRWLSDIEATVDGFSAYPTVLFRFSAGVDLGGTFKGTGVVRWIDITMPASPADLGLTWYGSTARNAYICDNWIGVRPQTGVPLTPGHTYAVVMTTAGLDASGNAILVSPDLTALLAPTAPSDAALATQWPKYQPLRDWATGANVSVSTILNAAVFTVGHPTAIGPKLASAVAAAPIATATSWINCANAPSPCPQATGDRACPATPDPAFDELHAMITLPIFQQGTEPYLTPTDGGDFVLAADGTPQVQRTEAVCMALTVPKGVAMPAGGWPLVVYAHGTGGSFRSHVTEGVAGRLASVDDGAGGLINMAVLGIDQVETGTRRGTSTESPDNLFYNFANPAAARGNPLQGAADQMSLVRFVTGFDLAAGQSPNGAEIKAGAIAFWGHSQGATEGGIAMPYTSGVTGAVLSGEGASIIEALLTKTNPVDIAAVVPVVLEEAPANLGPYHPVLSLFQNDLDRVDPLNHAPLLVISPTAPADQKHIFQPYGQGDTYAPPPTEQTFALAAQLGEAAPPAGVTDDPFVSGAPLPVPVGGNVTSGGVPITAIVRQYASDGTYDAHFVSFDNPQAEADVNHFLADAISGKVPQVGR